MKENRNREGAGKLFGLLVLLLLVLLSIAGAWRMSMESAGSSNELSYRLVDRSAELLMEQKVEWTAGFWHDSYNMMLRKLGHFSEYLVIGLFSALFFRTLLERLLMRRLSGINGPNQSNGKARRSVYTFLSLTLSFLLSFSASWLDEFYWQRISQRHPRWFDVAVDMTGASIGIFLCLLVFAIGRWAGTEKR